MTKCPNCQATLPDGAFQCQFCNASFGAQPPAAVIRPISRGRSTSSASMPGSPGWVLPAYYGIAAWWLIDGGWLLWRSIQSKDGYAIFGILIGGVTAIVGLGLLARIELVRGIVNILCFLQIIDGAFGVLGGFLMTGILGFWGAIAMVMSAIRIGLACLMIYLIGETDVNGPRF